MAQDGPIRAHEALKTPSRRTKKPPRRPKRSPRGLPGEPGEANTMEFIRSRIDAGYSFSENEAPARALA
eukprot:3315502-Pyramimonas_sp.AAC.1